MTDDTNQNEPTTQAFPAYRESNTYGDSFRRLRERTSVDGWNGPHSVAVRPEVWEAANALAYMGRDRFQYEFVPSGDGTVNVRFRLASGIVIDAEVRYE